MRYVVYNQEAQMQGSFESIYNLELFMDSVRNSRGDRYKELPKHSCFDYIKSIGWFMEICDEHGGNPLEKDVKNTE